MQIKINHTLLELLEGDITEADTEAIVNAANEALVLGGGVAGAIRTKGGPAIQRECDQISPTGIGCTDRTLVVAGDPGSSYLMDKVLGVPGICDNQMPPPGPLPADEIEVIRQWIVDLGDSFGGMPDGGT